MADSEQPPVTDVPLEALPQPDTSFRLGDQELARLQPWVEPRRLEQLLALVPAVWRPWVSQGFFVPQGARHTAIIRLPGDQLQRALEDVYQGWWEAIAPEWRATVLADAATVAAYPGVEQARARWAATGVPAP